MRSRFLSPALAVLLFGAGSWGALIAQAPVAIAQDRDWVAFAGAFPAVASEAGRTDVAIMLWLQQARTREEVARAANEVEVRFGLFSAAANVDLDSGRYPLTLALLDDAAKELRVVTRSLKAHFARPRPAQTDPRIQPGIKPETTHSYPSGHSAWGTVTAAILARLATERSAMVLAFGRQMGNDRVLGGVHYPSDVEAGQRLGTVLVELWLQQPARQRQLEEARAAEWLSGRK